MANEFQNYIDSFNFPPGSPTVNAGRSGELKQRAYQKYIDALGRLRVAEGQTKGPPINIGATPTGASRGIPEFSAATTALNDYRLQELMNSVRIGAMSPREAATIATRLGIGPAGSGSTSAAEMRAYVNAVAPPVRPAGSGSTSDAEMRAYQSATGLVPSPNLMGFFKSLFRKQSGGQ